MWLVVGLGNPGSRYEKTRHNAGFLVVDLLAERWGVPSFRSKFGALVGEARVSGDRAILCKPQSFMNCSGQAVMPCAHYYGIGPAEIVVVHDDMDLEFGRVKVKVGGGHGGHNGLKSLFQHLGTQDFVRVRVGIGRPRPHMDGADYVLEPFSTAEWRSLPEVLETAADAVEMVLREGPTSAMNRHNVRPKEGPE